MAGYQKHVTPRTEQGIQELQCRRDAILCINMYLQVLLWLRSVNVLPEVYEEEATSKNVVYRLSFINDSYSLRRARLQKLHSALASTDVLLNDGLVKESEVSGSWQEKNGTGNYPPPSIYAAIGSYLMEGVTMELKHAVLYYLLLDLCEMNASSVFLNELKKFPQIFGLSKSNVKLLKAFWYLDKRDTKNAIKKLLHPAVRVCDILPWQHQRIIKSFLFWKAPRKALKYINHMEPPQISLEDMKLQLSVLLACGAITQAYEYQRKKQDMGFGNELLNHLFIGCQELRKMKDLMYLPLNSLESWALVRFLAESKDPRAQESLVIYHLLHCNFFEAAKVNEKLSRLLMNKIASIYESSIHERSIDREALVESLMAAVSKTEKCLVEEMQRLPSDTVKKTNVEVSQPLSVSIKCSAMKQMTYSDILQSLICKASPCASPHLKARSSYFEDVPFLRPPVTPENISKPVSLGNKTPVVTKRSRLSTSPTEYSSPAKRSRLLDGAPFKPSPLLRSTPKSLAVDIVSLLQTPPIHRRTSKLLKSKNLESTPDITPQSILKKQEGKKHELQDLHLAPTPPLDSEEVSDESSEDEEMEVDRNLENLASNTESLSRQIRFNLPKDAQENRMSPSFGMTAQRNPPKSVMFPGMHETPENVIASKELGRTSFGSLTREPLRSLRKRISFREELPSVKTAEVDLKVEDLDKFGEGIKELSPLKIASLPQVETDNDLDREGETGMPITSFKPNPEIPNPVIDISETDSSTCKAPEPVDDDVEIVLEVQGHTQSFQRSHLSPHLPMRSDFPESKEQETTFLEGFQSGFMSSSKTSTSITVKDVSPSHSTASEDCLIIEQALVDDHSEHEQFYSPSADPLEFTRAPYTFSEPVTLFHENSNTLVFQSDSGIVTENAFPNVLSEQRPSEMHRVISFDFAEPCGEEQGSASLSSDSKMSGVKNVVDQIIENLSEDPKIMGTSFSFTGNVSSANTGGVVLHSKEENITEKSSGNIFATELEPEVEVEDAAEPKLQFKFSKITEEIGVYSGEKAIGMDFTEGSGSETVLDPLSSSESSVSQDKFTFAEPVFPKTTEEISTILDDKNFESIADSNKSVITPKPSTASEIEIVSKPRFAFSKPLITKVDEIVKITERVGSEVDVTEGNKSKAAVELPTTTESSVTRKSRFAFSKPSSVHISEAETSVDNRDSEKYISESDKSKDISVLPATKLNSGASKHRFTFSKPVPLKPSEEICSISEDKDCKMDITESTVTTKQSFTFRKPVSLSEENVTLSENQTVPKNSMPIEKKHVTLTETDTRSSRKTFVFTRSKSSSKASDSEMKQESENIDDVNQSSNKTDFLLSNTTGTYEEFSSSLKKDASDEESSERSDKKNLLSSPCLTAEAEGASLTTADDTTSKKKNSSQVKADKSTAITPATSKKKKRIGKSAQKIEFSFAEPTSPATPEILEILAKSPEAPLPSFMFSPPMTRGRLRKKRNDESMGSSFCSMASEMSFVSKPPPMDSILEGIMQEKKLEPRRTSKAITKKKSRKTRSQSRLDISSVSSILDESKVSSPSKRNSTSPKNTSVRHTMVLRQTKVKHKPENL